MQVDCVLLFFKNALVCTEQIASIMTVSSMSAHSITTMCSNAFCWQVRNHQSSSAANCSMKTVKRRLMSEKKKLFFPAMHDLLPCWQQYKAEMLAKCHPAELQLRHSLNAMANASTMNRRAMLQFDLLCRYIICLR